VKRIAQLVRMLGSSGNERRVAFAALERTMQNEGADGKYTEEELQEYGQALRAEGVEAGIKIGQARASNGGGNGHLMLPSPAEMAGFCYGRRGQLKDDKQREFINDMRRLTLFNRVLSPGRLGYLASIYIQNGGKLT
jgi:hypothetical protein